MTRNLSFLVRMIFSAKARTVEFFSSNPRTYFYLLLLKIAGNVFCLLFCIQANSLSLGKLLPTTLCPRGKKQVVDQYWSKVCGVIFEII